MGVTRVSSWLSRFLSCQQTPGGGAARLESLDLILATRGVRTRKTQELPCDDDDAWRPGRFCTVDRVVQGSGDRADIVLEMSGTEETMNRLVRHITLFVVMLMIASLVAACGGSDDEGGDTSTNPTTSASPAASPASGGDTTASPTTGGSDPSGSPAGSPQSGNVATTPEPLSPATPTAAPTEEPVASGPVQADALWFASDGQTVQGGTSRVEVDVMDRPEGGELRVGFFESEVGGSGPQWRAAGWMAVITASLLLGEDPSQYEFSFDVAGRIDGPSAGGLMTAAVVAGYLGDQIDPTVTMTGTINPDGTIGPVGGIPHKIEGAAAAGKTKVLVPGGQRYDYDYAAGQSVDLVQVGQQNGVEVILVPDIYTAYRELTGSELPQPESNGQAALPQGAFDKYRAGATSWYATYESERAGFTALPADVQEYRAETILLADEYAAKATQFLAEGQVSAAYENAFSAASLARLAREAAELDDLYYTSGLDPLIQRLTSAATAETRLNAALQRLEAEVPDTASDSIAIMDSFSNLSVAQGLIFQAQSAIETLLATPDYTEDDALTAIFAANYNYVNAELFLELAEDNVNLGLGFGSAPAPSPEVLTAISETLRRGAEANITYFEELIVNPFAQEYGVHPDIAKVYFQQSDNAYLTAVAAIYGAPVLAGNVLKPEVQASVNLGASLTAYSQSASLIAKYYSLGAQVDENGYITGYDRQTSLADMLDLADQRARTWLSSVAGEDPVSAIYYYDNARLYRTGTADDQLIALNYYWQSAILSATLGIFSGQ